jgi:hypothetical protein
MKGRSPRVLREELTEGRSRIREANTGGTAVRNGLSNDLGWTGHGTPSGVRRLSLSSAINMDPLRGSVQRDCSPPISIFIRNVNEKRMLVVFNP